MSTNGFKFEFMRAVVGAQFGEPGKPNHYLRVLVALWNYADAAGRNAYPTIKQLADDCRVSTRTVDRALDYLISTGWVRQVSKGRSGRASEYSLHIPEHDTGVSSTRHGCHVYTTPVSDLHDTGVVPTDHSTNHETDHGTDQSPFPTQPDTDAETPCKPPAEPDTVERCILPGCGNPRATKAGLEMHFCEPCNGRMRGKGNHERGRSNGQPSQLLASR